MKNYFEGVWWLPARKGKALPHLELLGRPANNELPFPGSLVLGGITSLLDVLAQGQALFGGGGTSQNQYSK